MLQLNGGSVVDVGAIAANECSWNLCKALRCDLGEGNEI